MGMPTQYFCDYWSRWVRLPRCVKSKIRDWYWKRKDVTQGDWVEMDMAKLTSGDKSLDLSAFKISRLFFSLLSSGSSSCWRSYGGQLRLRILKLIYVSLTVSETTIVERTMPTFSVEYEIVEKREEEELAIRYFGQLSIVEGLELIKEPKKKLIKRISKKPLLDDEEPNRGVYGSLERDAEIQEFKSKPIKIVEQFNGLLPSYVGDGNDKSSFSHIDNVVDAASITNTNASFMRSILKDGLRQGITERVTKILG
ncbi:hypothetical protein Tco_0435471 [Tanacetum coccineum]